MGDEMIIGSHVAMGAPDYYLGSVKEALSYGANTFMFYTGAPQNTIRKPTEELKIKEGRELLKQSGIDESKIIVHAPYIINAANIANPDLFETSIRVIISELRRTRDFHVQTMVLHPGAHVQQGEEVGIQALIKALNEVLSQDGTDVKIALETMAGKGSEIGINFEQIKKIIDGCEYKQRLGVCLDTCHINDAGYDLNDFDSILDEFDRIIGLDKLLVIHLNDSKNIKGAHKDRHENIGYGTIGFENLNYVAHHPRLNNIPKILETPYVNDKAPYKIEMDMLRKSTFKVNWKSQL